jgi:CRP/FNR family transcriptional regulator, cyclic AMP receptor protein
MKRYLSFCAGSHQGGAMIETGNFRDIDKIINLMSQIPALHMLDEDRLKSLLQYTVLRRYESGEEIILDGAADFFIYFLIEGHVHVVKEGVKIGDFRRSGDIFGEMGIIDGGVRSASVVARKLTLCLAIDGEFMTDRAKDSVIFQLVLYRVFAESLAQRLRKMNNEIIYLRKELNKTCGKTK